ncbi:MAG: thymidine phosphorylase [bacterium]
MNIYDILRRKRLGLNLSYQEIDFIVKGYYYGNIPDYQMSAFLTSTVIHGMNEEEIFAFTKAMIDTGVVVDYKDIQGIKVDKHSTGGVGDSVSIIVVPLLCCLGYKVPKLSGRSLGHTGGTIDKMESIPNLRTGLTLDHMMESLKSVGGFISQPLNLAPADKKIYALRDVTANVDSIPLIASSIMSKKIAANADVIILDVKVGNGAFMRDYQQALELSNAMISIAQKFGKKCAAIITDMNQPLNNHIGNYLEIISSIDFLKGNYNKYSRLKEVCFSVISLIHCLANNIEYSEKVKEEVYQLVEKLINTGEAIEKFRQIIQNQGGQANIIDDPYSYFGPKIEYEYKSPSNGFVHFDTYLLGLASGELGLSRKTIEDKVDNNAGIILNVEAGQYVNEGQTIMKLYAKDSKSLEKALEITQKALIFSEQPIKTNTIYCVVGGK